LWCLPVAFIHATFRENRRPGSKLEICGHTDTLPDSILISEAYVFLFCGEKRKKNIRFFSLLKIGYILDALAISSVLVKEQSFDC
jgi:hypothetical protein